MPRILSHRDPVVWQKECAESLFPIPYPLFPVAHSLSPVRYSLPLRNSPSLFIAGSSTLWSAA